MKKLQNSAAFLFIVCVFVLAVISIMGVWQILADDVISKSFQTVSLLAVVAVIVIGAGRFIDSRKQTNPTPNELPNVNNIPIPLTINPLFTSIRHTTVVLLIASVTVLTFLGVLGIWDVVSGDILHKSLSSIAIIAFSSIIVTITCLEREDHKLIHNKISGNIVVVALILCWIIFSILN